MSALLWLLIAGLLALVAYQAVEFYLAQGTTTQRLSAAWKGSLTIFVEVWGGLASSLIVGLDALAQITGDPQFTAVADSIKQVIPAQYHPLLPGIVAALGIAARLRTLPKGS